MAANKLLKDDVLKLRNEGLTYREICEKLNCSLSTVKYHCSKNNLIKRKMMITEEDFNLMLKMINDGFTQKQISEKLNISISSIKRYKSMKYSELIDNRVKMKKYIKNIRKEIKKKCVDYKGGVCQICGYNKSVRSLGFHHIEPENKDFSISGKNLKWQTIKDELDKCLLVCNNCHGEIHEEIDELGYSIIMENYIPQ